MNHYYKILGLKPGASQGEIKKAYFKLVRQYSPEKDAEKFQEIRQAYEQLQKAQGEEEGPVFQKMKSDAAYERMEDIQKSQHAGDWEIVRDACEQARKDYPDEIWFLFALIGAQRKCGNTGKAVKNAELLVSKEPDNKWFQKELAVSYIARGFTKKALPVCEKAYEMGCTDSDFLMTYAIECRDFDEPVRGIEVLQKLVHQDKKWDRDNIVELFAAYGEMIAMNEEVNGAFFWDIINPFAEAMERYRVYLSDHVQEILFSIVIMASNPFYEMKEYQKLWDMMDIVDSMSKGNERFERASAIIRANLLRQKLEMDNRLGETMQVAIEAFIVAEEDPGFNRRAIRYAKTDVMLCMLKKREEVLAQAEILKQDYNMFYEKMKDCFDKLRDENNLKRLKENLLREYQRMDAFFNNGYYYDWYPEEREKEGYKYIYDSDGEELPYVRKGKKIGRNDPCPCGSGLKYKQCCMNKNKGQ